MDWSNVGYILTGGFLKPYRTYIIMGLALAGVAVSWAVGDTDTPHAINSILVILGLGTAANHPAQSVSPQLAAKLELSPDVAEKATDGAVKV